MSDPTVIEIKEADAKSLKTLASTLNLIFKTVCDKLDNMHESLHNDVLPLVQELKETKKAAKQAVEQAQKNSDSIDMMKKDIDELKFHYESVTGDNHMLKKSLNHCESFHEKSAQIK